MQTVMPIRQRSPTNALPEDPMAFQTMRTRNPDGTSTVYHVHESMVNNNCGISGVNIPGFNYGAPSNIYGGQQQHSQQPNVVYVQSRNDDDDDDESDDDEYEQQPTTTTNSSSTSGESTALVTQSSNKRRRRKLCQPSKSTSPLCIATGIIIALSFIIGYIFMIETIVNHNRNRPSGVQASLRSGSSSGVPPSSQQQHHQSPPKNEYTVQDGSVLQEQLNLQPKYYMMKPVLTEVTLETMLNKQQLQQQQKQSHPRPNTVNQGENNDNGDGTPTVVQPRGTIIGEEQTEKIRTAEMHYSGGTASAKSRDGRLRKKK